MAQDSSEHLLFLLDICMMAWVLHILYSLLRLSAPTEENVDGKLYGREIGMPNYAWIINTNARNVLLISFITKEEIDTCHIWKK